MRLTSFGNSLPNKITLVLTNLSPYFKDFLTRDLTSRLRNFIGFWFFLSSSTSWLIWRRRNDLVCNTMSWHVEKVHQVVWDSITQYGRIEWQKILKDLEKGLHVNYNDILEIFEKVGGVFEGLIVTIIIW